MKTKKNRILRLSLFLATMLFAMTVVPYLIGHSEHASNIETSSQSVVQNTFAVHVAKAASHTFDLCASSGSITMPDSTVVQVWGFVETGGAACTPGLVTSLPGPILRVNAGDSVTINLTNSLTQTTSVLIAGQTIAASGGVPGIFATEAAANGGTASYSFVAQEGSYLYESGSDPSIQIPMGLYGALIVDSGISNQAYGHWYHKEDVLLLSEIDPNLNSDPFNFDLLTYHPTYWLINGMPYDASTTPLQAMSGEVVLMRYLNAGFDHTSMTLLGGYQRVIAKDGFALLNPFDVVAETIPAGSTADMLVDTAGLAGLLPVYNRNMYVTNQDAFPGGMMTFLEVSTPVGSPPTVSINSPVQGSTLFGDAVLLSLNADDVEDPAGSIGLTVEWNVDGGAWQSAGWTGTTYDAILNTTSLTDGSHTINARATDGDGNTASDGHSVTVSNLPSVQIVTPANSAAVGGMVALEIDASDAEDDAGGAGSLLVEWSDDGFSWYPTTYSAGLYVADTAWDTTVLAEGPATVYARATDSRANTVGDSNDVTVSNQPAIAILAPVSGSNVSGQVLVQIDASDVEDDAGGPGSLTVAWGINGSTVRSTTYNAGTGYYEALWDTTADGPGAYTVDAQITDSRGNTAGDTVSNITIIPPNSIHIGDIDDASVQAGGPNWSARAAFEVHDGNEATIANATVYVEVTRINKSGVAVMETLSCITAADGRCTIEQTVNENQYENEVTFTVLNISNPPADPYDASMNHDDDDPVDSDGTTIVVSQP